MGKRQETGSPALPRLQNSDVIELVRMLDEYNHRFNKLSKCIYTLMLQQGDRNR